MHMVISCQVTISLQAPTNRASTSSRALRVADPTDADTRSPPDPQAMDPRNLANPASDPTDPRRTVLPLDLTALLLVLMALLRDPTDMLRLDSRYGIID